MDNQPDIITPTVAAQPARPTKHRVCVCNGPSCTAQDARVILDQCATHFAGREDVEVEACGCTGFCTMPNNISVDNVVISRNTRQNAVENVEKALAGDIYAAGGGVSVDPWNLPDDEFLKPQKHPLEVEPA